MSPGPLRTLVVTRRLPEPPRSGVDLRYLNLVRALAALGPTFVFGLAGDRSTRDDLAGWRISSDPQAAHTPTGRDLAANLHAGTSPFATVASPTTGAELVGIVEEFRPDVAVVCGLELAWYLDVVRPHVGRLVLDLDYAQAPAVDEMTRVDANRRRALVWRQAIAGVEHDEARATRTVDQVWVSTAEEASRLGASRKDVSSVAVVPNAVDVSSYERAARAVPNSLLYTGRFDYWPNEDAARVLVRDVVPRIPGVSLALVGLAPPQWLRELDDDRVVVTGAVPDVRPFFAAASVMPVPLTAGGGTRLKVLEAFASGVPVVSTAKGVDGLDLVAGWHYLRAEDPDAFAQAIVRLDDDEDLAHHCVTEAMLLVQREFSVDAVCRAVTTALGPHAAVGAD